MEEYLVKKAPFTIPANIKEIIVKFAPWITLIVLIMALPALLFVLGIGTLVMPFSFMGGLQAGFSYTLTMILTAVSLVLEAVALPGLFKRTRGGWNLVYYASLVGVVQNIVSFNLGGLIIGSLLSFYVLFQVREYYK